MALIVASILLFSGLFFFLAGTVGLIRFPDVLTRMHATTKCDTLGAGLVLLGLLFYPGNVYLRLKILLVIAFLWLTNPTAAHYMARAVFRTQGRKQDASAD